jgi:hypothetical protein
VRDRLEIVVIKIEKAQRDIGVIRSERRKETEKDGKTQAEKET